MKLEFDLAKQAANIKKHGFDFAELTSDFFATALVEPARGGRYKAIGLYDNYPLSVVFKPLGTEAISIISMRIASKTERRLLI